MKDSLGLVVIAVAGLMVATVGSVAYRSVPPVGVVLCGLLVLLAAVFARTWWSWTGLGVFAVACGSAVFLWTLEGPGGSVLIAADALGYGWLAGATGAIVVAALLPRTLLVGEHV